MEHLLFLPGERGPTVNTYNVLKQLKQETTGFPKVYLADSEFSEVVGDVATIVELRQTIEDKEKCAIQAIDPLGIKTVMKLFKKDYKAKQSTMPRQIRDYYNAIGTMAKELLDIIQNENKRPEWIKICDKKELKSGGFSSTWLDTLSSEEEEQQRDDDNKRPPKRHQPDNGSENEEEK